MIPTIDNQHFPVFMPDQVLTSQNLNDMFNYQDEQGRLTRANLIGIGIVCGLEIKTGTDANGSYIVITKGTGVTSEGYLVTVPETKYHKFVDFNSEQCRYYEPFVNLSTKKKRFDMWELKQLSEVTGTKALSAIPNGLNDKVVMLFVELLETNNKNCDPNSCDDKGINVQVNIKPLLVRKIDAAGLITTTGVEVPSIDFNDLTPLRMPRWDVPNTLPVSSSNILNAYRKVLSTTFIQSVETALTEAYKEFKPLIIHDYPTDPFVNLAEKFAFLQNPTLTATQVLHIQYYYDFFSDLIQAYDEFCKTCKTIHSACCPDQRLFPRHLLLGEVVPPADDTPSAFKHFFIYSPLFECKHLLFNLRTLFERMDVMIKSFDTPPVAAADGNVTNDLNIRVTPSVLGPAPLSDKAIPYYYKINLATFNLYKYWNADKKWRNHVNEVLSYHAAVYSTIPHVKEPLKFDLEPYNFLRVEGIVGKPVTNVLRNVQKRIDDNRLPIQVVALKTGDVDTSGTMPEQMVCETRDLEINYDVVRREWEAIVGKTIEYIDDILANVTELLGANRAKFLKDFKVDLHLAKTYLVDDLPAFAAKYEDFMEVFERIEATAESLRKQFMTILDQQTAVTATSKLLEDLIDHLDEVILSCRKGAFRAVYQEYKKRLGDIFGKQFFGYYAKHNPGIQHKAGAPTGGTFILVYHAKTKPAELQLPKGTQFVNGNFAIKGKITDNVGGALMNVQVFERTSGAKAVTASNGNYSLKLTKLPAVINVKANGYYTKQLIVKNASELYDFKLAAIDIKDTGYDNIDEGIVIADFFLPYSCCSDCTPVQFAVQDPPANKPPIARAGDDISIRLPINKIEVDGRNSEDPEGRLKSYQWTQKTGPSQAVIADATLALTLVENLIVGEYVFELTVTDDEGATSTDTVTVTVLEALNIPPVANAGSDRGIILPAVLILTGTATDTDGTIASVLWTVKAGSPAGATFASQNTLVTQVNNLVAGTYTFILTVTDNKGASASDEVVITVQPAPNVPPVVNAGADKTITLPAVLTLAGTATDADGSVVSVLWTIKAGSPTGATIVSPNNLNTQVNNVVAGTYTFILTATDNKGATASDEIVVTVQPANLPPVVSAGPDKTITLPSTLTLQGTATDADGSIASVQWSVKAGSPGGSSFTASTSLTTNVNGLVAGTYTFVLSATDNKGSSAIDEAVVTVRPANQIPTVSAVANPAVVTLSRNAAGALVATSRLIGTAVDPDGDPLSLAWTLASGPTGASPAIATPTAASTDVTFTVAGTYVLRLTASDGKGGVQSGTAQVTVNQGNQPPTAVAKATPTIVEMDDSYIGYTELDGSNSKDPEGKPMTYKWQFTGGLPHQVSIFKPDEVTTKAMFIATGTFKFTLTAFDDSGLAASDSVDVVVNTKQGTTNLVKSCGSLTEILSEFKALQVDQQTKPLDLISGVVREQMQKFYQDMETTKIHADPSTKNQITFFKASEIEFLLRGWIDDITNLMKPDQKTLVPLTRILNLNAKLAYYITCIQTSDIDATATTVKMADAIKGLEGSVGTLVDNGKKLSLTVQKSVFGPISSSTKQARVQVINGKEETRKPNYLLALGRIIFALEL